MVVKAILLAIACALCQGCFGPPGKDPPSQPQAYVDVPVIFRPRWSPDGSSLAYLRLQDGLRGAVVRPRGGAEKPLLGGGEQLARFVTWGPQPDQLSIGLETPTNPNQQLYTLAISNGKLDPLAVNPKAFHELGTYSADGRRATISSNARNAETYDIYLQDMETGKRKLIFEGRGRCLGLRFSGADRLLVTEDTSLSSNQLYLLNLADESSLLLGRPGDRCRSLEPLLRGRRVLMMTDQDADLPYLAELDIDDNSLRPLGKFPDPVVEYALQRETGQIVVVLESQGSQRLYRYDPGPGTLAALPGLEGGVFRHLRFLNRNEISFLYSRYDTPPSVMTWELDKTSPKTAFRGEAGKIEGLPMTRPERVTYDSGGLTIPAWLYRPGKSAVGAIVYLDHQPCQQAGRGYQPAIQWLVDQGYCVLAPNFRGSSGQGRIFESKDDGSLRPGAVHDVVAAADFLNSEGVFEISLFGRGYGGYLAASALLQAPKKFRAASVLDADLDLNWILEDCRPWQRREWREELGDTSALSLLPRLAELTRPLLVIHRPRQTKRYESLAGRQLQVVEADGFSEALELTGQFFEQAP